MNKIVYQDADYCCVYKAPQEHFDEMEIMRSVGAPGEWEPVHRLDYETSGLILWARAELVRPTRLLFQDPTSSSLEKVYWAGSSHPLPQELLQQQPIQGWMGSRYRKSKKVRYSDTPEPFRGWHSIQPAAHNIRLSKGQYPSFFRGTPYEVRLLTGARHQIRAYFAAQNCSLVGDPLYGTPHANNRLELVSWKIAFQHPQKPEQRLLFELKPDFPLLS